MMGKDRFILGLVAIGLWMLVWQNATKTEANAAYQGLTRYDVQAAIREALRENPAPSRADIRAVLQETLSRCTISGRLTEEEAVAEDSTDFIARIRC